MALVVITLALGVKMLRKPLGTFKNLLLNMDTLEAIMWILVASTLFVWLVSLEHSVGTSPSRIGLEVSVLTLAGVTGGLINRYNKDGH